MRWYFAIDEAGARGRTGSDAKTAVRSALRLGGLEPFLLYHGARNDFTNWMTLHGVRVIDAEPSFADTIRAAEADGIYKAHSIGHWLRVAVPLVESSDEFVLYTDCDVVFLKRIDWSAIRPPVFAAAPEFRLQNWNYFNAGVMVLNIPKMRASYAAFEAHIRARILSGKLFQYDDEVALNEAYRGTWSRLDPALNWKLYWGFNASAGILHFHGPKLDEIEAIGAGRWTDANPTAIQFSKMLDGHIESYIPWLRSLGDQLQLSDLPLALRYQNAASALLRRQRAIQGQVVDTSFMDFCMFQ